jgi:hypothetical protein
MARLSQILGNCDNDASPGKRIPCPDTMFVVSEPSSAPRGRATLRDLVGAVVVLLVVVGAVVGFTRSCSFSPGGPTVAAPTNTVDVPKVLGAAASSVDFPVRRPALPDGWRANSSSTTAVGRGASVIVRIGWLTPARYVQLSQSGGTVADVVAAETGRADAGTSGQVDVAGTRWTTYPGRRDEQAWVTRLDRTTMLITGSGSAEEFRTLAAAVQSASPVSAR